MQKVAKTSLRSNIHDADNDFNEIYNRTLNDIHEKMQHKKTKESQVQVSNAELMALLETNKQAMGRAFLQALGDIQNHMTAIAMAAEEAGALRGTHIKAQELLKMRMSMDARVELTPAEAKALEDGTLEDREVVARMESKHMFEEMVDDCEDLCT